MRYNLHNTNNKHSHNFIYTFTYVLMYVVYLLNVHTNIFSILQWGICTGAAVVRVGRCRRRIIVEPRGT